MKRPSKPRREQPQLNTELPPEQEGTYSLEDIIQEFGGWSKRTEPEEAAVPAPEEPAATMRDEPPAQPVLAEEPRLEPEDDPGETPPDAEERPEAPAPEAAPSAPKKPSRFQWIRLEQPSMEKMLEDEAASDAPKPQGAAEPPEDVKIWTYRRARAQEPPQTERPGLPRRQPVKKPEKRPVSQRPAAQRVHPRPSKPAKPEPVYPPAEEAYQSACTQMRGLTRRRRLSGLLCVAAIAVTVFGSMHLKMGTLAFTDRLTSQILLGMLLVGVLPAYDVLVNGLYQILQLRVNLESMLFVQTVVFALDGFLSMSKGKAPYTAVLLLGLHFAMWARCMKNRARRSSLKAALGAEENPSAAFLVPGAWNNRDCVFRAPGGREHYVADLEAPSGADRVMHVYAPLALCMSLVLAAVIYFLRGRNFLWSWSAMLAGSLPAAAFLAYWRPFCALAGRLLRSGAALCGWQGAKSLASADCVAVEDSDLFSRANVSMNGMKVFGEFNVSQVVGYTYAVVAESGCGLEPVFHEVFVNQNGRNFVIDNFRRYEGGGIGAEIQGEVILVGSIAFMQLMGVRMPEGTNVRQAVYCAVNKELAAVFALNYHPSAAVKSAMQTVARSKGLTLLLATRDFIVTPAMIRHKYKISGDLMEYPAAEERARLSDGSACTAGQQAALFARDSFLPLAEAVAGGRGLVRSVRSGLIVDLMGGCLGFAITAILSYLGAFATASAVNLMLFALLWTVPALLLTAIGNQS